VWALLSPDGRKPAPRAGTGLVHLNGALYIFGGQCDTGLGVKIHIGSILTSDSENPGYLADLWKFELSNSTWSSIESVSASPWRRYGHSLAVIDGSLYVFGGDSDLGENCIFF
jgi:N-acetylneuraminic acid mutarotase